MSVVVVTYEFTFASFSGNGMLSRSMVHALLRKGVDVTVICCQPAASYAGASDTTLTMPELSQTEADALHVLPIQLTEEVGWRRLDKGAAWDSFATGAAAHASALASGPATVCIAIDWHGAAAWNKILASWPADAHPAPPMLYYNFRVYSMAMPASEGAWYDEREQAALADAAYVISLSQVDQEALKKLAGGVVPSMRVLGAPLRSEVQVCTMAPPGDRLERLPQEAQSALNQPTEADARDRSFLTCLVRLSPEKEPMRFVELVEALAPLLRELSITPLLAGAESDAEYAREVKERLRAAAPDAVVIDRFLAPPELSAILTVTTLNVHPCKYDAYGMTIIEAAAFGVPSVINATNVGAATFLGKDNFIPVDWTQSIGEVAGVAKEFLTDKAKSRKEIGASARVQALKFDEKAYGKQLIEYIGHVEDPLSPKYK